MRCLVLPHPLSENPYQRLLHDALAQRGVTVVTDRRVRLRWGWAPRTFDAVHLHWVEYLFSSRRHGGRGYVESIGRALRLIVLLGLLRLRGVPIVWTVHNLRPHDARRPRLERLTMLAVAKLASTLHVHSHAAGEVVRSSFGSQSASKIVVAYHGNYAGAYEPDARERSVIRRDLGLHESACLYLLLGTVRPNKRVPEAIRAYRTAAPSTAQLAVVGRADGAATREINAAGAGDEHVLLRLGFVPDEQIGSYLAAADAMILNYEEVFSSGALLLALTFGVPVIVPREGSAPEIVGEPGAVLFEAGSEADLRRAIASLNDVDLQTRRTAAARAGERFSWGEMADALVAAYRESKAAA